MNGTLAENSDTDLVGVVIGITDKDGLMCNDIGSVHILIEVYLS